MIPRSLVPLSRRAHRLLAPAAVGAMLLAGCSNASTSSATGTADDTAVEATADESAVAPASESNTDDGPDETADDIADDTAVTTVEAADPSSESTATTTSGAGDLGAVGSLASSEVHEISIQLDDAAFQAMVETYNSTGDKEWIEATVTIDGSTYERAGIRLKGNSSLRGVTTDDDPATLPWLIKLDEFVDDQEHDGLTEMVVRSNGSATSLNEAVALELLDLAGLASQDGVATGFSVNGSDQVLRLVIDNPDGDWMDEDLGESGALYKAESTGDYSYRGDDPTAYDDVFDQEAGKDNADLTPLIQFLDFINNSDDATFAAELGDRLDIDSFATYLAMQDLLDNFDDIDGPGNNSYLYYDTGTEQFTVVPWDYNLAFGIRPGGMGAPGEGGDGGIGGGDAGGFPSGPVGGDMPTPPEGFDPGQAGGGRGGFGGVGGGSNILVERFTAVEEWNDLYLQRVDELRAELFDSGVASDVLAEWSSIMAGSGLVDQATIDDEASQIATNFS